MASLDRVKVLVLGDSGEFNTILESLYVNIYVILGRYSIGCIAWHIERDLQLLSKSL